MSEPSLEKLNWKERMRRKDALMLEPDIRQRLERIIAKNSVPQESGCIYWNGYRDDKGYGIITLCIEGRSVAFKAHRAARILKYGFVPFGAVSDHTCRTHECINPDCIDPVESKVNTMRGDGPAAINAAATHCVHGHQFTPDNTYTWGENQRRCRTCAKAVDLRFKERRRAKHTVEAL